MKVSLWAWGVGRVGFGSHVARLVGVAERLLDVGLSDSGVSRVLCASGGWAWPFALSAALPLLPSSTSEWGGVGAEDCWCVVRVGRVLLRAWGWHWPSARWVVWVGVGAWGSRGRVVVG